jgi:hypothetical protein
LEQEVHFVAVADGADLITSDSAFIGTSFMEHRSTDAVRDGNKKKSSEVKQDEGWIRIVKTKAEGVKKVVLRILIKISFRQQRWMNDI